MDTNNGVEAQNKLLKYSYLPNRKNITLSSLVSHIIESFLPDRYQKYLLQNYQMTEAYRSYSDIIPDYLRTRPHSVIIHCLDRVRKANKFSSTDVQEGESEGCFNVTSQSGKVDHVDLGVTSTVPSCTCMDWIRHHIPLNSLDDSANSWSSQQLHVGECVDSPPHLLTTQVPH